MKYLKRTIDDVEKIYYQLSFIIIYNNRTGNLSPRSSSGGERQEILRSTNEQ